MRATSARIRAFNAKNNRGAMKKLFLIAALLVLTVPAQARDRWTPAQANAWYAQQKWLVGSNYMPANAINQLEMWQEASFDPARIDGTWLGAGHGHHHNACFSARRAVAAGCAGPQEADGRFSDDHRQARHQAAVR